MAEAGPPHVARRWEAPARRRRVPLVPLGGLVAAAALVGWLAAGHAGEGALPVDRQRDRAEEVREPDGAPPTTFTDDADSAASPWQRLPHSPLVRRAGHSITWAGDVVFVWGGSRPEPSRRTHLGSGALYEPATDRWRRIGPAPIPPRDEHVAAWSGEEVLVWGGRAASAGPVGAAYDPSGGGWRLLPEGPLDHAAGRAGGAWSGSELLVWAVDDGLLQVAAYDPARDLWRARQGLPLGAAATVQGVWAGDRLALLVHGPAGVGALYLYRPADDAWELVGGRAFPRTEGFAAVNGTLVLWGHTSGEQFGQTWAVALDARTGDLRRIPPPSVRLGADHVAVSTGARLVVWDGRRGAVLDLLRDRWTTLPDAPLAARAQPDGVWTGTELVVWGGAGGRYHADGARLRPPPPLATQGGGFARR